MNPIKYIIVYIVAFLVYMISYIVFIPANTFSFVAYAFIFPIASYFVFGALGEKYYEKKFNQELRESNACPRCKSTDYEIIMRDYEMKSFDFDRFYRTIHNVDHLRCNNCGREYQPTETLKDVNNKEDISYEERDAISSRNSKLNPWASPALDIKPDANFGCLALVIGLILTAASRFIM